MGIDRSLGAWIQKLKSFFIDTQFLQETISLREKMDFFDTQLNKPHNGKLQFWYGSGSNGKTTLLRKLVDKYDKKDVYFVTTIPKNYPDAKLVIIKSPSSPQEATQILAEYENCGNKQTKHVVCSNFCPEKESIWADLVEFKQVF